MRVLRNKYDPYYKDIYLYREDLEKIKTLDLVYILRSLRRHISQFVGNPINQNFGDKFDMEEQTYKMEGRMVQFNYNDHEAYHTVFWIVKDILSKRPHVVKSKQEKRLIRQLSAKNHKRIKL